MGAEAGQAQAAQNAAFLIIPGPGSLQAAQGGLVLRDKDYIAMLL